MTFDWFSIAAAEGEERRIREKRTLNRPTTRLFNHLAEWPDHSVDMDRLSYTIGCRFCPHYISTGHLNVPSLHLKGEQPPEGVPFVSSDYYCRGGIYVKSIEIDSGPMHNRFRRSIQCTPENGFPGMITPDIANRSNHSF